MDNNDYKKKSKRLKCLINELTESITQIEKEIQKILDNDEIFFNQHKLLRSVDGVGE